MKRHAHAHRFAIVVRGLIHRTHGQDLIEYAILMSIATAVGVLLLNQIGSKVGNYFENAAQQVMAGGGIGAGGGGGADGGGDTGGGTGGGGTGGGTGGGGTGGGGTGDGGTGGGGTGGGGRGGGRGGK